MVNGNEEVEKAIQEAGFMYKVPGKGWALTPKGIRWAEASRKVKEAVATPAETPASDTHTTVR